MHYIALSVKFLNPLTLPFGMKNACAEIIIRVTWFKMFNNIFFHVAERRFRLMLCICGMIYTGLKNTE